MREVALLSLQTPLSSYGFNALFRLCLLTNLFITSVSIAQTQENGKPSVPNHPVSASSANVTVKPGPRWNELSEKQRKILHPLGATWNTLGTSRKEKWLVIANNYPNLSPAEQSKLTSRMAEWAALKPHEREQARLNFADTKKISPSTRAANWEAYQALSPEDRQKLASQAAGKPAGAAIVVKPVAPNKLTTVPFTRHTPTNVRPSMTQLDPNTLLPRPIKPTRAASTEQQAPSN
jgi:hypothetical protein